jgi:hypothetical protein
VTGRRARVAGALGLGALLLAPPAVAQPVALAPEAPSGARGLLPRYRFYLSADALRSGDRRFDWDADVGGDLDLLDYGRGRVTALANFETVLGDQLREFDPNQGNYTLDLSASVRSGTTELALVFHHLSRHLSDRAKSFPIDWNMLGLRSSSEWTRAATRVQVDARSLWTLRRSFVDYRAEVGAGARVRRDVSRRLALVAGGELYGLLVDRRQFGRRHQGGGRVELGVRVAGAMGAVELFAGVERRVDADPLDPRPQSWGFLGFRLLSL